MASVIIFPLPPIYSLWLSHSGWPNNGASGRSVIDHFEEVGDDSFILATPNGNMLWTCDPFVVNQLLIQHDKSQVPVDIIKFYDLWGPTVGSVEGDEWRTHRNVITAAFTPATNTAVWRETTYQAQTLVDH